MKKLTLAFLMTVASCGIVHASFEENNPQEFKELREDPLNEQELGKNHNPNLPNLELVQQGRENRLAQQEKSRKELEENIKILEEEMKEIRLKKVEFEIEQLKKAISGQYFARDMKKFENTEDGKRLKELQMQLIPLNNQWNKQYSTNSDKSVGATFGHLPPFIRDKIMFDRGIATIPEASMPSEPSEPQVRYRYDPQRAMNISETIEPSGPSEKQMDRFWNKRERKNK